MKVLRRLDSSGDTVVRFDETTPEAMLEAKALLARALMSGGAAFKVNRAGGLPDEKVTDFNALENETVVIPRVVGG